MSKTNALRLLDQQGILYDTVVYTYDENDLSVAKIAEENGLHLPQIFKTLVTLSTSGEVIVALVPGDKSLSNKKLAQHSGHKKIDLAPLNQVQTLTGYIRGGCSPLGMKKQFRTFMDESALNWAKIYVNAGKRGLLFGCEPQALAQCCQAAVVSLCD